MITLRPSAERGHADHGWLRSHHSFSFAGYQDPRFMGFGNLRVLNEDRIAPGTGFPTHGHRDMEIVSYVLEGALSHADSLGSGSTLLPGEVQRMSAGTGIRHSEFNGRGDAETHFLQIWLLPDAHGVPPSYEQRAFPSAQRRGRLCLVARPQGPHEPDTSQEMSTPLHIGADVRLYAGLFDGSERAVLPLDPNRLGYAHVARGELMVNGHRLQAGDAAMLEQESQLSLEQGTGAEVLFFDLRPMPA